MSDLISDLRVINGGWRATLKDGTTIDVTDKEIMFAGCAQDAVAIKIRDRNLEPTLDAKLFETGWQNDGFYCGLRAVTCANVFEYLVDPGDLDPDPLPAWRAAAGRVTEIEGKLVTSQNLRVVHALSGKALEDLVYADAAKNYAVVLTPDGSVYAYARIDGIAVKIACM